MLYSMVNIASATYDKQVVGNAGNGATEHHSQNKDKSKKKHK